MSMINNFDYVKGVKGAAETEYRTGGVVLTLANIGLVVATVEETKAYFDIG